MSPPADNHVDARLGPAGGAALPLSLPLPLGFFGRLHATTAGGGARSNHFFPLERGNGGPKDDECRNGGGQERSNGTETQGRRRGQNEKHSPLSAAFMTNYGADRESRRLRVPRAPLFASSYHPTTCGRGNPGRLAIMSRGPTGSSNGANKTACRGGSWRKEEGSKPPF